MLLSIAMRLGSMLGPQCFGFAIDSRGGMCALGAAARAVGILDGTERMTPKSFYEELADKFPGLNEIVGLIAERNDSMRQSREKIADWLVESGNDMESVKVPDPALVKVAAEIGSTCSC